jgi:hypothetical protein
MAELSYHLDDVPHLRCESRFAGLTPQYQHFSVTRIPLSSASYGKNSPGNLDKNDGRDE